MTSAIILIRSDDAAPLDIRAIDFDEWNSNFWDRILSFKISMNIYSDVCYILSRSRTRIAETNRE